MKKDQLWKEQDITHRFLKAEELSRPTGDPTLPLVIESKKSHSFDSLHNFVSQNKTTLRQLLARHGGILFRGFDVTTPEQFETIMSTLSNQLIPNYSGIAPRKHITDYVFTSTEAADQAILAPHSEMAYSRTRPGILGFYCQTPPLTYGETPLFNCELVYNALSKECLNLLEGGIQYVRYHPKDWNKYFFKVGDTWTKCFSTTDKKIVEGILQEAGASYEWNKNDTLKITTYAPVIITHPLTKKKYVDILLSHYINYIKTFDLFKNRYSFLSRQMIKIVAMLITLKGKGGGPTKIYDQKGRPIPSHIIKELHEAFWNHSVIFSWQKNDILILDNIVAAHSRMNVVPPRKILVCLGDEYSVK